MKKSRLAKTQLQEIRTIKNLASALEGVSSIRISQIKDRVVPGRECFEELWKTYSLLRATGVKGGSRFDGKDGKDEAQAGGQRPLAVVITSDSSLGETIDNRIINYLLSKITPSSTDIAVIGTHGAQLLAQRKITPVAQFSLPEQLTQEQLKLIGQTIHPYETITVYYQSYQSLGQQTIRQIDLIRAVAQLANKAQAGNDAEVISDRDYLFEPDSREVIATMESTMLQIALREVILDSQLAQLASRFTAMVAAEDKAGRREKSLFSSWRKAVRDESDRQQRAIASNRGVVWSR